MMGSRDLVSFSRLIIASLGLVASVTNLLSWDGDDCNDNFCNLTSFLSAVFDGNKQPKQVGKCQKLEKI